MIFSIISFDILLSLLIKNKALNKCFNEFELQIKLRKTNDALIILSLCLFDNNFKIK